MSSPSRRKIFSLFLVRTCPVASLIFVVILICGMQTFLFRQNLGRSHREHGPAHSRRDSLRDFSDEKPHQLIFVDPAKHDSNSRSFRTEYTRSRRWRVPSSTHSAARKAADRLIGTNPQHSIVAREQEYEELVQSLRKSGKIGTQRRTSGKRQRTVQDLPKLQVSSNLIHAAQIGIREASHGYQLTGGVKPKNKLGNEHLDVLKRMRGGSIKGSIWQ